MAETVRKTLRLALVAAGLLLALNLAAQKADKKAAGFHFTWRQVAMDQSRTGTSMATADNVAEALGTFDGTTYVAPNGRRFKAHTTTARVARALLDAQPAMAEVKTVIGYAPEAMKREGPECALYNLIADLMMRATEKAAGKKVDFALTNRGGIRTDLPQGDIIVDDIASMLPFKNYMAYLELKGADIRRVLEQLAAVPGFQVIGGARVVIKGGKLVSAEIGGKPLDDRRTYGVATNSFLLNGGDNIFMARNALALEMYEIKMGDMLMEYVQAQTAAGLPIVYQTDGRVKVEE